jgi:hypothetical protein
MEIMDQTEPTRFRRIYVAQPGHDFKKLLDYTDEVKFINTGLERIEAVPHAIRQSLADFAPDEDAIVAVGRANATLLLGVVLQEMFPGKEIVLGVYRSKVTETEEYRWVIAKMA